MVGLETMLQPGALTIHADACVPIIHREPTLALQGWISSEPLPPIHSLAFELLAEIMVLALAPHIGPNGREVKATATDVQRLCQVCSYWRAVALQTARLWITTPLPIMTSTRGWEVALSPTKMFLEHSAPLPISVYILGALIQRKNLVEMSPTMFSVSDRWRTFEMTCHWDIFFDVTFFAQISSLENLESLHLSWTKPEAWRGSELYPFLHAPRLRDVTIEVPLATSNNLTLPWGQLTCLSLTYDSPQFCLDILASCTKLVTAYVDTKQWLESDSPHNSYVARSGLLAHLTELRIPPFLRRFRLPALKTLDLSVQLSYPVTYEYFVDWLTPALTFLLARSPDLQCLRLGNGGWDSVYAEDMPDILCLTPNLTDLSLTAVEVNDGFFQALRYAGPDTTPLVPKLDTLALIEVGECFEEASFGEMLRSRWWSDQEQLAMVTLPTVSRLKHLRLWCEGFFYGQPDFEVSLPSLGR
ncbi:hypothetical protein B0H16DRAFT_1887887 [Mycena metata]|uniref:F-box domain-containing protein n=1 Tax=Mycena metata TaxID=1033252 RepID=A0AAD7ITS4_9AGAR|nr:hypothetical protein B0H16DRAFT_1887887 [Mycena metata]